MTLEQRAIWIVCIEIAYSDLFRSIVDNQSEWTCNRSIRWWEGWVSELRDSDDSSKGDRL